MKYCTCGIFYSKQYARVFDREVHCGHRNSFVVVVVVVLVLVGRLLSKIAEIHYFSAIALF